MAEQNTQAVVLQQPNGEKLQFELKITQVADDTTAMKSFEKGADISIASFDSATYIAVSLALFATGLAYWYGRKSFKLTEMSFKTVVEEIKASQQSAMDLNTKLFAQQLELQRREQAANLKSQWIENFRPLAQRYMSTTLEILFKLNIFREKYLHLSKGVKQDDKTEAGKHLNEIALLIEQAVVLTSHIDLFLESYVLKDNKIIYWSDFFNDTALEFRDELINVNQIKDFKKYRDIGIRRDTDEISKEIYAESNEYIKLLENKDRLGVLVIYSRMINEEFKFLLKEKAA